MCHRIVRPIVITVALALSLHAGVGESAVITLVFPYGARASAMGEVGTALANDESALFFNPAGLGIRNEAWRKGATSFSFEKLLPEFEIDGLSHVAGNIYYQISDELGGIGLYYNHLNMGRTHMYNPYQKTTSSLYTGSIYLSDDMYDYSIDKQSKSFSSYESVLAIGWGCTLPLSELFQNSFGLSFKYVVSALVPGLGKNGEGVGRTFAIDAGYLAVFPSGLRLGLNLTNMGPDIFYIDEANKDPLPFTLNAAVAYTREFIIDDTRLVNIAGEFRIDKELVINHFVGDPDPFYKALFVDPFNEPASYEFQEINYHLGFEAGFYNTLFLRYGTLIDPLGSRFETHCGLGVSIYNHIRCDLSFIIAPEGYMKGFTSLISSNDDGATGARHKQFQFTVAIDALGGWREQDQTWWKVNEGRSEW